MQSLPILSNIFLRRPILPTLVLALLIAMTGTASCEVIEVPRALVTSINATEVPARETGVLAEITVRVGQMVKVGEPMARIDDEEAKQNEALAEVEMKIAIKQAQTAPLVAAAEAAATVAANNLQRAEAALAQFNRSLSLSEVDDYRLKNTDAQTLLWQRKHENEIAQLTQQFQTQKWNQARSRTKRHHITAPISGMVNEVYHDPGEWVIPGQSVVRIQPLDQLRCVGFVPADQVSLQRPTANGATPAVDRENPRKRMAVGDAATLTVPSERSDADDEFPGRVTFIDPEIEPESGQVKIWVDVDNQDLRLRPGTRGTLTVRW